MGLIATNLFRQYGAPVLAIILAGLYVWNLHAQNDRLREKNTILEGREAAYVQNAQDNAAQLATLSERLNAEQELSLVRLEAEQGRRNAAETRNNRFSGAINDLKQELEGRECGIGAVLTDGLRANRGEREADRQSREARITDRAAAGVSSGGGPAPSK